MAFNIQTFGHIPYNTDNLPERTYISGPGTLRPIGFALRDIMKLYWTVRSFKVTAALISITDPFTAFMLGGGSSGTIVGSEVGLAAAGAAIAAGVPAFNGRTRIRNKYTYKNRLQPSLVFKGKTQTSVQLDKKKYPILQNKYKEIGINEGSLCSAGPVHSFGGGQGGITIDFSDIIKIGAMYYPRIYILLYGGSFVVTSSVNTTGSDGREVVGSNPGNMVIIGGISFGKWGVIPMYGWSALVVNVSLAAGSIQIGERCSDRFYFDGQDLARETDPACVPEKAKAANTINDSGFTGGGGGESGGGGAGASW